MSNYQLATKEDLNYAAQKQKEKFVAKETGKGLSANDLTNALKANYDAAKTHADSAHAPSGAQVNILESIKVNGAAQTITSKAVDIKVPTKVSELTNDSGFKTTDTVYTHPTNHAPSVITQDANNRFVTDTEKTNWNAAKTHADGAHAPSGAQANILESIKVNGTAQTITSKAVDITVPTKTSQLTNDSGFKTTDTTYSEATTSAAGLLSAADKTKLNGIAAGAQVNVIESLKVNGAAQTITSKAVDITVPTKVSTLTNDSGYQTAAQVQTAINTAVAGVYKVKGSIAFTSLPTTGMAAGDVYNITDAFTTDAKFTEGAGKSYPAGTNVAYTTDSKWDCLAGVYDLSVYVQASEIVEITNAEIDAMYA